MPVYFEKDKQRWRFQFNRKIDGRRRRASRLLPAAWDRARAEKYDRKKTGDLYAIATGIEQERRLIGDAVKLYLKHKIPKQKAGRKAALHLAALVPWYQGRTFDELPDVALEVAEGEHGWTTGTVHNRLQYLKAACRYAWKAHWRKGPDPTSSMTVPAANNARRVYDKLPQLNKLWASFEDPEDRAVFRIAFYAGLRWTADLLPCGPQDIVRAGKNVWLDIGTTKNGEPILKPVHPAIRGDLKYLPFKKHPRTYYAAFEEARDRAGMTGRTAHDLRHSLASIILSKPGGSLADVQAALHQKTAAAANRYAHLYPERLRKVLFSVGKRRKNTHRRRKLDTRKAA